MHVLIAVFITLLAFSSSLFAAQGFVRVKSAHDVKSTADRLQQVLESEDMIVFARIDHALGAKAVGTTLRPTELVIFGNPAIGSKLMQCNQSIAIDLPQKALIFEDEAGQVWLAYNEPEYLAKRHNLRGCGKVLQKVTGALDKFATAATKQDEKSDNY